MFTKNALIAVSVTLAVLGAGCVRQEVSFTKEVRPILQKSCLSCHAPGGEGYTASGFSAETYESVMKGTKLGPVIVPGSSISSTLVILIEHKADPSINMPRPREKQLLGHVNYLKDWKVPILPAEEIKLIRAWIDQGAKNN
ncbi:MAG: hypothetical protein HY083_00670 [Gammaproteobacteria bacterium]|nr:hypothetical protein [Gammaproteobacteria bacterium]